MTVKKLADTTFADGIQQLITGYESFTKLPSSQLIFSELGSAGRLPLPSETRRHFEESAAFALMARLRLHPCAVCSALELWLSEVYIHEDSYTPVGRLEELWVNGRLYGALKHHAGSDIPVLVSIERERFTEWLDALEGKLLDTLHCGSPPVEEIFGQTSATKLWLRFVGERQKNG